MLHPGETNDLCLHWCNIARGKADPCLLDGSEVVCPVYLPKHGGKQTDLKAKKKCPCPLHLRTWKFLQLKIPSISGFHTSGEAQVVGNDDGWIEPQVSRTPTSDRISIRVESESGWGDLCPKTNG